eukprot:500058-Ditylum_brightwellii.AAC.1
MSQGPWPGHVVGCAPVPLSMSSALGMLLQHTPFTQCHLSGSLSGTTIEGITSRLPPAPDPVSYSHCPHYIAPLMHPALDQCSTQVPFLPHGFTCLPARLEQRNIWSHPPPDPEPASLAGYHSVPHLVFPADDTPSAHVPHLLPAPNQPLEGLASFLTKLTLLLITVRFLPHLSA